MFPGEDWIFFHHALVRNYEEARVFLGFPAMYPWDGSTPIPLSEVGNTRWICARVADFG